MPSMANITVKANDGTTDVVLTAISAAAGDKAPAVWRNNGVGDAAGKRPEFRLQSRNSGQPANARRSDFSITYPALVTSTDTGVTSVASRVNINGYVVVSQDTPQTVVDEAVAQAMNFLASSLVKASMQAGYAPV